jgi:hypothetical protein
MKPNQHVDMWDPSVLKSDSVIEVVNFVVSKWPIFPSPCSYQLVEAVIEV